MWNVVFMGTPDFAVRSLQALLASGEYQVQAVVHSLTVRKDAARKWWKRR